MSRAYMIAMAAYAVAKRKRRDMSDYLACQVMFNEISGGNIAFQDVDVLRLRNAGLLTRFTDGIMLRKDLLVLDYKQIGEYVKNKLNEK